MNILIFLSVAIGSYYLMSVLQAETFVDLESNAFNYYGIPIVVIGALTYLLFGPLIMIAHLCDFTTNKREHI